MNINKPLELPPLTKIESISFTPDTWYQTKYLWSISLNGFIQTSLNITGGVGNGQSKGIAIKYNTGKSGYVTILLSNSIIQY